MFKQFASVGGLTLLSRLSGFARDIIMAYVLGAGRLADAFLVAFRIPNHFRAIFAEGAFNAAYIPTYARLQVEEGRGAAQRFYAQLFSMLIASQVLLLLVAWLFMPQVIDLLAPGYRSEPAKFALALHLTRITFPYLACIVLVTLHSATLNANRHFAAAAFAPILLNVCIGTCLALAFLFPNAAYAASYGVLVAGFVQMAFIMAVLRRTGFSESLAWPRWDADMARFFRILGPAVIGSAGVQIAIFADTIIASTLGDGAQASINYADRLYLLPVGVIGVAAGTVLLPEMSRRLASKDASGAFGAQNMTLGVTLALTAPFFVAFLMIPDLLLKAAFMRGRFNVADAFAASRVLFAYALGLLALVSIRPVVAGFQAMGDLKTPMYISLTAVVVNVALKLLLVRDLGAAGLAAATAMGAWINVTLLAIFAYRRQLFQPDGRLLAILAATLNAALWLAAWLFWATGPLGRLTAPLHGWAVPLQVIALAGSGGMIYGGLLLAQLRIMHIDVPLLARFGRFLRV